MRSSSRFVGRLAELHGQHGEVADEHVQLRHAGLALEPAARQRVGHLAVHDARRSVGTFLWVSCCVAVSSVQNKNGPSFKAELLFSPWSAYLS